MKNINNDAALERKQLELTEEQMQQVTGSTGIIPIASGGIHVWHMPAL